MPRSRLCSAVAVAATAAAAVGRVWAYDVPLNTHKIDFWDTNQVVGWPERPVPRAHHSVSYLRRMVFVFGGVAADDAILSDLHFYDTVTRRWSGEVAREWCCDERGQVVNVERGYQPPAARSFHAAVAHEEAGRLYILGGYNGEVGELGDVQYFDPAQMKWSGSLEISGPAPLARSGHVAFLGPDGAGEGGEAIYIFGGYSPTGGHLNDLHKLTLTGDDFTWSEVFTARTAFGGGGSRGPVHSPPLRPSPRRHAAAAVTWLSGSGSPGSGSAIIVGGISAPTVTSGSGQGGGNETVGSAVVFGDVWQLRFLGARAAWQKLEVSGGDAGGGLPRFHHACIASRDGVRFVITGGRSPSKWSSTSILASTLITAQTSGGGSYDKTAYRAAAERDENVEEGVLPPLAHTLSVMPGGSSASLTTTPGALGSVSPSDPCRTPSGITEAPLLQMSKDLGGGETSAASPVAVGRYGHAAALHGGYIYEFGGFGETEAGSGVEEGEKGLLLGGLRVSYLAEGGDGRLCPVWVESV